MAYIGVCMLKAVGELASSIIPDGERIHDSPQKTSKALLRPVKLWLNVFYAIILAQSGTSDL